MKTYVAGSLNMDMVLNVERMPRQGETMYADAVFSNCGGKGANQAVACARLGLQTAMIGKTGDDGYGRTMIENLKKEGIDVSGISVSPDAASGMAFILVSDGDNRIVLEKGANDLLTEEEVDKGLADAGEGDILVLQLEIPKRTVYHALKAAKQKKMISILNPAPAAPLDSELPALVEILILNETEAETITGRQDEKEWMKALQEMGFSNIILTTGAKGADICSKGVCRHIPARKVKAVDTTAAGDTFIGGIACGIGQGLDLAEAGHLAAAAAGITVTRKGAGQSIPTMEEVLQSLGKV